MPGWLYILQLSTGKYYIGSTTNYRKRIKQHQDGKSVYTSKFLPIRAVFKQKFVTYSQARKAEIWLKKSKDKRILKRIITEGKLLKVFSSVG